jgi:hypothetical protein
MVEHAAPGAEHLDRERIQHRPVDDLAAADLDVGFSLLFGAIVLMRMRAMLALAKVEARLRRMAA